jgi:cation transport regulator ChaC
MPGAPPWRPRAIRLARQITVILSGIRRRFCLSREFRAASDAVEGSLFGLFVEVWAFTLSEVEGQAQEKVHNK